jgi:hypothetical protein
MYIRYLSTLCLLWLLPACIHAQNSGKYLRKFHQEDYVLYFLTPTTSLSQSSDRLQVDFTFLYRDSIPSHVDLRFSLYSKSPSGIVQALRITNGPVTTASPGHMELLFVQKEKDFWHTRYATTITYAELNAMLAARSGLVYHITTEQRGDLTFPAGKRWQKAAPVIQQILGIEIRNR